MLFKYALKEIVAHPRYTLLFIINVVLGLSGLAAIEIFNESVLREVHATSRATAGGDLVIWSRLPIEKSKVQTAQAELGPKYEMGEVEEVLTMATYKDTSRLVQLKAQTPNLPFYGEIETEPANTPQDLEASPSTWVSPDFLTQMNAKVGDRVTIGSLDLTIAAVIKKDRAPQIGRGAIAPRVYVSRASLEKTGLIQKGSTVFYQKIFKLEPTVDSDLLAKNISTRLNDTTLDVKSHTQSSEASARLISYLSDYLGLVSLIALLLSNIGSIYLFRAHLIDRLKDMSIFKMLGLRTRQIITLYAIEVLLLAFIGVTLAGLLAIGLLPILATITQDLLPFKFTLVPQSNALLTVALVGISSTFLCLFPLLAKIRNSSPSELFQESFSADITLSLKSLLAWLPVVLFFYLIAIWQANSLKIASLFVASLLFASALIFAIGYAGLRLAVAKFSSTNFELKFAVTALYRRPLESLSTFVALSLGALLVTLIFTIEGSLQSEFDLESGGSKPSLFLFDIQEEQVSELKKISTNLKVEINNLSPLIRARLTAINDSQNLVSPTNEGLQTREDQEAARSRNRSFNLTERAVLSTSETIISGRAFSGAYNPEKPPEISLEERFSERIGATVGDRLTFEVLGVPITGEVVSVRRVKWASFQPNFFVQFQEGVFADAPKTYLASTAQLDSSAKAQFQRDVVRALPNVSMIDVEEAITNLLETTRKMAIALKSMALLVLLSSLFVVVSIHIYHRQRNHQQRALLNLFGLVRARVLKIERFETSILLGSSMIFGFLVSYIVAWPITHIMFARTPSVTVQSLTVLALLIPVLIMQIPRRNSRS